MGDDRVPCLSAKNHLADWHFTDPVSELTCRSINSCVHYSFSCINKTLRWSIVCRPNVSVSARCQSVKCFSAKRRGADDRDKNFRVSCLSLAQPGEDLIKLFSGGKNKLECLSPANFAQASLTFVSRDALPEWSTWQRSQPYSQTSD
jgi:hypothetical protein